MNKTLYKYQKATMRPIRRVFYDKELLVDRYQIRLGKTVLGSGTKEQSIPLKRELNCSGPKRTRVNWIYTHTMPDLKKRRDELYIHKTSRTIASLGEHFMEFCKTVHLVPTIDHPDFVQFQNVFLKRCE